MENYDFSGWATRNNLKCSDGRTIIKDAFKHNDGKTVPLVWNHQHNNPDNVLGHALLENREEGVYAYCKFNDTRQGNNAKMLVEHGDVKSLSIYANQLKQKQMGDTTNVIHGEIRELSLVLAGANPGAFIDSIISHSDGSDEEAVIYTGEDICLSHAEESSEAEETVEETTDEENCLEHADENKEENPMEENKPANEKTVKEVFETLNEEQEKAVYAVIGAIIGEQNEDEDTEGGNEEMKHNVFDQDNTNQGNVLTHSDEAAILDLAKSKSVGSLQEAIKVYAEQNETLAHSYEEEKMADVLFPEYHLVKPGAPEKIERDQTWVGSVMNGATKSPFSRIRTRQADVTGTDLHAKGYAKGEKKNVSGVIKLLQRTTDPQTVYRKDSLHRDDIIDITDFDIVAYQYGVMRSNLEEEIAKAILVGDGRDDLDADKIKEDHIRSIWHDDELYSIHVDVDYAAAKAELQGSNTSVNFGENYIKSEATVAAVLYANEKYKGSGNCTLYCTPHAVNVMLLARDLNGRRIYDSVSDLAKAFNVNKIQTVEQFEGLTRTDKEGNEKKLVGIIVNMKDYMIGSTKGGEITKFSQFDIDYNQEKYLIETRLSGALTRVKSAIVLEEPVVAEAGE